MDTPLDLINDVLDQIARTLAGVGVELSAFHLQLIMLILATVLLFVLRKSWWPPKNAALPGLMGAAALLVVMLMIVASWVSQRIDPPLPTVAGTIIDKGPGLFTVQLLDLHQHPMGRPATIDQVTGDFLAFYQFSTGRYPRSLAITGPGCTKRVPVSLSQLREGHVFQIRHDCVRNDTDEG